MLPTPPIAVDDETRARTRAATYDRIAQHQAARRRRRRVVSVAGGMAFVLVACVGTLMIVVGITTLRVSPAPSGVDHASIAPATAAVFDQVSLAAEQGARREVPAKVGADDFVFVRSYVISNEGRFGDLPTLGKPHERLVWFSQDPRNDRDDVIREFGQDWPIDYSGGNALAGPRRPTFAWLATLPHDPDRLLAELRELNLEQGQDGSDATLFSWIGDLAGETMMPPETAAALWQAAKLIPGVTLVPDATDALGRHGVGITLADASMIRSVWVFDPTSYRFLGGRQYMKAPASYGGEVLSYATAIQQRAIVPGRGLLPGEGPRRSS